MPFEITNRSSIYNNNKRGTLFFITKNVALQIDAIVEKEKCAIELSNIKPLSEIPIKTWYYNDRRITLFLVSKRAIARIYSSDGTMECEIPTDDIHIPKRALDNWLLLFSFVQDTYVRLGKRTDGSVALYVNQQGKGGGFWSGLLSVLIGVAGTAAIIVTGPIGGAVAVGGLIVGSGLVGAGLNGLVHAATSEPSEDNGAYILNYLRALGGGFAAGAIIGGAGVIAGAVAPMLAKIAIGAASGGIAQVSGGFIAKSEFNWWNLIFGICGGGLVGAAFSSVPGAVISDDAANIVIANKNFFIRIIDYVLGKVPEISALGCNFGLKVAHDAHVVTEVNKEKQNTNKAEEKAHKANTAVEEKKEEVRIQVQENKDAKKELESANKRCKDQEEHERRLQKQYEDEIRKRARGARNDGDDAPLLGNNRNTTFATSVPAAASVPVTASVTAAAFVPAAAAVPAAPANDESRQRQNSNNPGSSLPPKLARKR